MCPRRLIIASAEIADDTLFAYDVFYDDIIDTQAQEDNVSIGSMRGGCLRPGSERDTPNVELATGAPAS